MKLYSLAALAIIRKVRVFVVKRTPWMRCTLFYISPENDLASAHRYYDETKTSIQRAVAVAAPTILHCLQRSLKTASILAILVYLDRLHSVFQRRLNKNYHGHLCSLWPEDIQKIMESRDKNKVAK